METGNPRLDELLAREETKGSSGRGAGSGGGVCIRCGQATPPGNQLCGPCIASLNGSGRQGKQRNWTFFPRSFGGWAGFVIRAILLNAIVFEHGLPLSGTGDLAVAFVLFPHQFLHLGRYVFEEAMGIVKLGIKGIFHGLRLGLTAAAVGVAQLVRNISSRGKEVSDNQVKPNTAEGMESNIPSLDTRGKPVAPLMLPEIPKGELDASIEEATPSKELESEPIPTYPAMKEESGFKWPEETKGRYLSAEEQLAGSLKKERVIEAPTIPVAPSTANLEGEEKAEILPAFMTAAGPIENDNNTGPNSLVYDKVIKVKGRDGVPRDGYRLRVYGGGKPVIMCSQVRGGIEVGDMRVEEHAMQRGQQILESNGLPIGKTSFIEHCPKSESIYEIENYTQVNLKRRFGKVIDSVHTPLHKEEVETLCGSRIEEKVSQRGEGIILES